MLKSGPDRTARTEGGFGPDRTGPGVDTDRTGPDQKKVGPRPCLCKTNSK
jgi:hypothetical protein